MTRRRIRVYLAEDHPIYLEGVTRAIKRRPELELVGTSTDGSQALADLKRAPVDVALLDVRMPGSTGTEILESCRRAGLETKVVFLSAYCESELIYQAIAKGAVGYLSKLADPNEIFDAIAAADRGETVLSREFQSGLVEELQRREVETRPALTSREKEILALTAEGHSAPGIAQELHLSVATIKSHLQSLYEKLGVSDRACAVAVAMRKGLLD
jgi:two-component system nitrate/nitrite response regulator NarL